MRCFFRFFTSSRSTSMKMNLLHTTIRKQMTRKDEKQQSMWICHAVNSVCFFHRFLFINRQHVIFRIFAVNQDASINKNSKNSNSRNLKQHTFAKSISFCCFCFCLILKHRSFHYINLQIFSRSKFSTKFSFSWFYIFCFRIFFCFRIYFFTFVAFVSKFFVSTMIKLISESQSTNFFAMSIDRKSDLFVSKRNLKKTKK